MRPRLASLFVLIAACRPSVSPAPMAGHGALRISFVAEADSFRRAAQVYDSLWVRDGARITRALEAAAKLTFEDTAIHAIVFEGVSSSGYREMPMRLRASYPTATKQATLMHELGHRLESGLFRASEDDHPYLFLWLYDAWVAMYGEDFAHEQVAVEKRRRGVYPAAWDSALVLSATQRRARWDSVRTSRMASK